VERKRYERTTAAYTHLRGVLAIPGGLLAIVFALGNWRAGPFASDLVVLAAVAVSGGAWYLIDRAYRRRYGRMTATQARELRTVAAAGAGVAIVFGGALLLHSRASWSLDLPVNAIAVTLPIAFVAMYAIGGALRAHHLVIWGAVLVAGVLPIWEGPPDAGNVALVMCGAASILSGVLDHLAFTRMFTAPALDA
jgi:hypothetical protein